MQDSGQLNHLSVGNSFVTWLMVVLVVLGTLWIVAATCSDL